MDCFIERQRMFVDKFMRVRDGGPPTMMSHLIILVNTKFIFSAFKSSKNEPRLHLPSQRRVWQLQGGRRGGAWRRAGDFLFKFSAVCKILLCI